VPGAAAADGTGDGPARDPLRIGAVALTVRDLDRTAAFYRDVIGLEVLARADGTESLGVGGAAFLELIQRPDLLPDDPAAAGLYHTAFLLPSRVDLGRWLVHWGERHQPLDGAADHLVSEAVYLHDPEGNGIEVYADRPRSQWRWSGEARERRVDMTNGRLDIEGLVGEARTPWLGAPEGTRIGHVHLRVGDISEAERFYGGVLGMDVVRTRPGAVFLSTGGYHHHLAANTWQSAGARRRDPRRAGLASVTLEAADRATLARIARHAGDAALDEDGLLDPWGTRLRLRLVDATASALKAAQIAAIKA